MNVDVNKIREKFLNRVNDNYNEEVYFIESCYKFPDKYTSRVQLMDLSLQLFFEQNNKIVLDCCGLVPYCKKGTKRKIKLANISDELNQPDINIVKNYIIEKDVWEQSQF